MLRLTYHFANNYTQETYQNAYLARTTFHVQRAENKYLLNFVTQIFRYGAQSITRRNSLSLIMKLTVLVFIMRTECCSIPWDSQSTNLIIWTSLILGRIEFKYSLWMKNLSQQVDSRHFHRAMLLCLEKEIFFLVICKTTVFVSFTIAIFIRNKKC